MKKIVNYIKKHGKGLDYFPFIVYNTMEAGLA